MLSNYFTHRVTFSLNVTRCYDVAKNAATAPPRSTMFPRGDNLPCHPVNNVIFILLYRMSQLSIQLQFYVIKLLYAPGDIFIECHPLL